MLDWVRWAFGDPYDTANGLVAYLGVPCLVSIATAVIDRKRDGDELAVFAALVSLVVFFTIYILLFDVHSTLPIGIMLAIIPFGITCAITVKAVRMLQRAFRRR